MKDCKECLGNMQQFILERIVPMGIDAAHFLKNERDLERYFREKFNEIKKEKEG